MHYEVTVDDPKFYTRLMEAARNSPEAQRRRAGRRVKTASQRKYRMRTTTSFIIETARRCSGAQCGRGVCVTSSHPCDCKPGWLGLLHEMFGRKRSLPRGPMAETFEAYRTRVLSYLGDKEPISVQQATPSQLDRRLRDVAPEELIRRPAPEKWSICRDRSALGGRGAGDGVAIANTLANPGVALTWWDEAAWAERLGYAQQDASLSARVFRALRESNSAGVLFAVYAKPRCSAFASIIIGRYFGRLSPLTSISRSR